ncbi:hypothetical protein RRG08_058326 [Elysia crispata]|uniref:Uncharacterized protein n=1 Tax=Elysia crispata TaxID=231223 RepID=A0AAE0ZBL0_9GAST|nr:hypothetical protein RRG08_058326 [Elysia crispata]
MSNTTLGTHYNTLSKTGQAKQENVQHYARNTLQYVDSTERVRQSVPVQMVLVCTQLMTNISERSAGDQKEPSPRRVLIAFDQA